MMDVAERDPTSLREGSAGMHDLASGENFNRTLKSREVLENYDTVFLPRPEGFDGSRFRMLLVQGPHDERSGTAVFPLGLGYIARILNEIGVAVEILDAHAQRLSPQQTLDALRGKDFNVVGITALSTQYKTVKWLAAELKKFRPDAPIIVGGQLAHYNAETVIEHSRVDVCVIGEGEVTIQDILYHLDDLSSVKGIAYRSTDGSCRRNPDRPRISNPDAIPFPLWSAFDMDHYLHTGFFGSPAKRTMNVLASRGCPYSCTFCSLSFPNVTNRSVENVLAEIRELKERFGIDGVMFSDELFVINKKRVLDFCRELKPLAISWGGQGRANIVNDDTALLRAMRDAGATYIGYGLESATSELLTKMHKVTTVEQNANCVKAARDAGLTVVAQFMFGFPGETLESIKEAVDFFDRVHYCPPIGLKASPHISLTTPLPGSQLYEDCKASGVIVDEDAYLEKITVGYFHNKEVVVNLTRFSDDELLELKKAAEATMLANYLRHLKKTQPFFMLRHALRTVQEVIHFEGFLQLIRIVISRIKSRLLEFPRRGGLSGLLRGEMLFNRYRTDYAYRQPATRRFVEMTSANRDRT